MKLLNLYALIILALTNRPMMITAATANPSAPVSGAVAPASTMTSRFVNLIARNPNRMGWLGAAFCGYAAYKSYSMIGKVSEPIQRKLTMNYGFFLNMLITLDKKHEFGIFAERLNSQEGLQHLTALLHHGSLVGTDEIADSRTILYALKQKHKSAEGDTKKEIAQEIVALEAITAGIQVQQDMLLSSRSTIDMFANTFEMYGILSLLMNGWACINEPTNPARIAHTLFYDPAKKLATTWALAQAKNFILRKTVVGELPEDEFDDNYDDSVQEAGE